MPCSVWRLVAYGLCFGLQNKATWLQGRFDVLDAMLACAYCTGFHCGWMTWCLDAVVADAVPPMTVASVAALAAWCAACAAFCYLVDSAAGWFDGQ